MSSNHPPGRAISDAGTTQHDVEALAKRVASTLQVSRALLMAGRQICLTGLEIQVAEVCDRAASLASHEHPALRFCLLALRTEIDTLTALLQAREAAGRCPSMTS
ncbi:hypothetical protein [Lichenicoccus sp.]|uniref:hypothetical protein n=1 Tax=Lichenicoccus sp. TaxID=2781899 RepID=UPI003D0A36AA